MKCEVIGIWRMSSDVFNKIKDKYKEDIKTILIEAIKYIEDNPKYPNVGRFSHPNELGYLQLDAAYMEGNNVVGAVIESKEIVNPIEVAYDLAKLNHNIVLAGDGADEYAKEKGFKTSKYLETTNDKKESHDTFGIISLIDNHFVIGMSTSGRNNKHLGRVGDTPLTGCGYYCEDNVGACIATGDGEAILRSAIAKEVVDHIYHGLSVKDAVVLAGDRALRNLDYNPSFCLVAMDKNGEFYAYSSKDIFPFSIINNHEVIDYYCYENEVKLEDEFLKKNYHGD